MKTTPSSTRALVLILAAGIPLAALADEILPGTVTVEEDLIVSGAVEVGEAHLGSTLYPAYTLVANSAVGVTIVDQIATGGSTTWNWVANNGDTTQVIMKLEDSGKLSLYSAGSTTPKVVIDGEGILHNGSRWIDYNGTRNSLAIGYYSAALGFAARANSIYSTAIGSNAYAYGERATASGASASASANYATSLGTSASASGFYATALGSFARASDNSSIALGNSSDASGYYGAALGSYSSASGFSSIALGRSATATGDSSIALGRGIQVAYSGQFALGHFNRIEEDATFMLGNGTGSSSEQRSNLFVIKKDGRGIFRSTSYVEPTEENPVPKQPEVLTVEGSTTVKGSATIKGTTTVEGDLILKRRQGNIGMGSFGRAEDQSPGN